MNRYGIAYPDGTFTGPITDSYRLAQAYAREHQAAVYDSQDAADVVYERYRACFGEEL